MSKFKVFALPVFRRYWLWTAKEVASGTAAAAEPSAAINTAARAARSWRDGHTLEDKFSILGEQVVNKFQQRLGTEWHKLESAREGTIRNRGYRLAQGILSREDPMETFLKTVPTEHASVQVVYPVTLAERLVRRRLRCLALQGQRRHRTRILWWSFAMIPQLPLMLTPLPNITVYYTLYRLYSHFRAFQGCKALQKGFTALDSEQLRALRDDLLRFQASSGVNFPTDSWPARLIRKDRTYLDIFERLKMLQRQRRLEAVFKGEEAPLTAETVLDATDGRSVTPLTCDTSLEPSGAIAADKAAAAAAGDGTGMNLSFYGSADLDSLVQPRERLKVPLSDEAALEIGQVYGISHLLELVARARRRVLGSMFPAHTEEWGSY